MDTNLLIGVAVMVALIGIAASRELLRRTRSQAALLPVRTRDGRRARSDDVSSL